MIVRTCCYALILCTATAVTSLAETPAAAEASATNAPCVHPRPPGKFPNGNTATKQEMLDANSQVKQYVADMNAYMGCLTDKEPKVDPLANPPKALSDAEKKKLASARAAADKQHNAAVAEAEEVAARFNEQLHVFNAKQAANPSKN